ncbi:MAG: bifunctional histidinol-phosphatase/imidazoleglycerol-phosphate dehydratase HisB [Saprospiraceae bacterium]|nr:bifunctional histidinol-phosphatase/imidazoleglycerol-phosphate dehydratase HisB [Saprospiraceae bacterium]MDG2418332.1 bifunctional histidinol-phosphatase/imidazoleglycerol-phosphate dehydratase HisB [Saprospiraceae bacterium]
MKKVLFIDRDGTLVLEPPVDYQLDTLEKLEFFPKVFQYLSRIVEEFDFELVMVTNQDGLGTESFPEDTFHPPHNMMMRAFSNEGIEFEEVIIDNTFPHENALTRKPQTGLLTKYMNGEYDLENSFVIGDRLTDMQLAVNLGTKGIYINDAQPHTDIDAQNNIESDKVKKVISLTTNKWRDIYTFLKNPPRKSVVTRTTKETDIKINLNLDGKGVAKNETGIGFFDHMLDQLARHSGCDLEVKVIGDLHIDEHHTIEDTALALGEAFLKALGSKMGIERYGFCLPMDDCLAQVAIDFGGRSWLVWDAVFKREMIGKMPTEMFYHFFKSFTDTAKCNLNIKVEGTNEHHKIEAIFKAWAKAIKMAKLRDINNQQLPSTKGIL